VKAGAVTRIGRDLVFDGERYRKWLRDHSKNVEAWKNAALERHRKGEPRKGEASAA
jgi:hypothetical protein